MLYPAGTIKQRGDKGDTAQDDRINPDQRVPEKIGAQAGKPMPKASCGFLWRAVSLSRILHGSNALPNWPVSKNSQGLTHNVNGAGNHDQALAPR